MSSGHRHGNEKAASALADSYYDRAKVLVDACTVVRAYQCPWLANRSMDGKCVYVDESVPKILKCGIDTDVSLPWHELPEWLAMNDGLPYDEGDPSAHIDVATPLERREVERQKPDDPDIWSKYSDELDGYIKEVDDENVKNVPPDIDLRPFEDDDKALLEQLIADGADPAGENSINARAHMPQILKPSDFAKRIKAGETPEAIFLDASGARKAKLVGLQASLGLGDTERSVDFIISTGALDRYNSTIKVDGWEFADFIKNPVVLWAHDDSIPAIGRAESVRVEGGKLHSRAIFADKETHPLADTIYQLIKGNFISAASVGWIPIEWKFVEEEGRGFGIDYLRQELLEWSVVNIPANPECLVGARSMGIDTKPIMLWAEHALDQGGMLLIPRDELEALRKAAGAPKQIQGARVDADGSLNETAAALKTLLKNGVLTPDEFADRLIAQATTVAATRAGKAISATNEKALRTGHDHAKSAMDHAKSAMDHCQAACDHVMSVILPDDGDDDSTEHPEDAAGGTETNGAALEQRQRRVRQLKLSTSPRALEARAAA